MRWPRKDIDKFDWHAWFAWYPVKEPNKHALPSLAHPTYVGWASTHWEVGLDL